MTVILGKTCRVGHRVKGSVRSIDKYIGEQIRRRRVLAGLSQVALASELGVAFQQLQKYEKGINRISAGYLFDCCRVLKCSPNDFFCDVFNEHESEESRSPDVQILLKAYTDLDIAGREAVLLLANRVISKADPK